MSEKEKSLQNTDIISQETFNKEPDTSIASVPSDTQEVQKATGVNSSRIIGFLAKDKVVEGLIKNISKKNSLSSSSLDDLAQDIYISLLEKPPEVIESLYATSSLTYYIARMVTNNIHSSLSPYYYKYLKPLKHSTLENDTEEE